MARIITPTIPYPYVRAWGRFLGSLPEYVDNEVLRATQDSAPQTALYKREDGSWATYENCSWEVKQILKSLL